MLLLFPVLCFVMMQLGLFPILSLNLKGHFRSRFSIPIPENIEKSVEIIEIIEIQSLSWIGI